MSSSMAPGSPESSRASTRVSSPEGGVRLDSAEFSPPSAFCIPQPAQRLSPATRAFNAAGVPGTGYPNKNSGDDQSDDGSCSSSEVGEGHDEATITPLNNRVNRDNQPKSTSQAVSSDSDSDDVFSPAKSPGSPSPSAFSTRLSHTVSKTDNPINVKNQLRPSRSVTFKDEDEMISPVDSPIMSPIMSPTKNLSERRQARRAFTIGNGSSQIGIIEPLVLYPKASDTPARHQVGDVDAQGVYPPTACVFVANLPEPKEDRALEAAVTREFSVYGTVFVKIRRDNNNMPFAFCQFTKDEDALAAMEQGKGTMILGRPCRTEMVKANRSFIIWKRNATDINVDEARGIMEQYGELNKCEPLHHQVSESMGLPSTILVEFKKFDPSRDITSVARMNPAYQVDAYDTKRKASTSRATGDEEFLKQYDVNRRSIYVAGLPLDTDEDEIAHHFSAVGEVLNVQLNKRTLFNGKERMFAFVEFSRADIPDTVVAELDNSEIRGYPLSVQRKVVKQVKTPKRIKSMYALRSPPAAERPGVANEQFGVATPRSAGDFNPPEINPSHGGVAQQPLMAPTTPQKSHSAAVAPGPSPIHYGHPAGAHSPVHHRMMYPGIGHPYSPPGYVPPQMHPNPNVYGGSLPNTPSGFPHAMTPYPFNGGFWPGPGLVTVQDPNTGLTYVMYNSPVHSTHQPSPMESPLRPGMGHPESNQ